MNGEKKRRYRRRAWGVGCAANPAAVFRSGDGASARTRVMGTEDPENPKDFESLVGDRRVGRRHRSPRAVRLPKSGWIAKSLDDEAQTAAKPIRKRSKRKQAAAAGQFSDPRS
jgi:hypothetical protein